MSNLYQRVIGLLTGTVFAAGLTGCTTEKLCLAPGCDNVRIGDTGACYEHGSNAASRSYKSTGSNYSSTDKEEAKEESPSYSSQSNVSNSGSGKTSSNTKKYDTRDVSDYDNPDAYASDFAEDFAYDEFGTASWEAYEYGYEAAYEYWMNEMGK